MRTTRLVRLVMLAAWLAIGRFSSPAMADEVKEVSCPARDVSEKLTGFTYTTENFYVPPSAGAQIANVHAYGWGAKWPFCGADEGKDFEVDGGASLDARIRYALSNGQQVMLTCAIAPSAYVAKDKAWSCNSKYGIKNGGWCQFPKDDDIDKYAQHCADIVKRFPCVRGVDVWNEFKGLWPNNSLLVRKYEKFYELVYKYVKAVNPDVLVAGPYVPFQQGPNKFAKCYSGKEDTEDTKPKQLNANHQCDYGYVKIDHLLMDALVQFLEDENGRYDAISFDAELDTSVNPHAFVDLTHYVRNYYNKHIKTRDANSRSSSRTMPIWWAEFYDQDLHPKGQRYALHSIQRDQQPGDVVLDWREPDIGNPFLNPEHKPLANSEPAELKTMLDDAPKKCTMFEESDTSLHELTPHSSPQRPKE